jgi:glycosyltransferase involved in cell wall biosynthesis
MKILVVLTTDWVKRYPAQHHHLMELLSLRGHEIRVVDFELLWRAEGKTGLLSKRKIIPSYSKVYSGAEVTLVRPLFIRLPILDYVSIFLSDMIEIKRQVREFKPDIIVSFGVIAYIAGLVAKRNGLPFVYYWIDVTHRLIPVKAFQPIGWLFERRALKLADVVFTINAKLKEYVIKMGADPDRTIVLGAGIDFSRFDLTIEGKNVRKHYGIKEKDLVLFFMGWLYNFAGLKEVAIELSKRKVKKPKTTRLTQELRANRE